MAHHGLCPHPLQKSEQCTVVCLDNVTVGTWAHEWWRRVLGRNCNMNEPQATCRGPYTPFHPSDSPAQPQPIVEAGSQVQPRSNVLFLAGSSAISMGCGVHANTLRRAPTETVCCFCLSKETHGAN
eukprot:EG_transcript_24968